MHVAVAVVPLFLRKTPLTRLRPEPAKWNALPKRVRQHESLTFIAGLSGWTTLNFHLHEHVLLLCRVQREGVHIE
jgi:hypothetical protein